MAAVPMSPACNEGMKNVNGKQSAPRRATNVKGEEKAVADGLNGREDGGSLANS